MDYTEAHAYLQGAQGVIFERLEDDPYARRLRSKVYPEEVRVINHQGDHSMMYPVALLNKVLNKAWYAKRTAWSNEAVLIELKDHKGRYVATLHNTADGEYVVLSRYGR